MIGAARVLAGARRAGFGFATGVPCSDLGALIAVCSAASGFRYVGAANEGDAVAIASGAALGGVRALALMQNSGLGNAVNPLTSLNLVFRIPVLLVIAWRGEPDAAADEPQHATMGRITTDLLALMDVPFEVLTRDEAELGATFARAGAHLERARTPYALVVAKGTIEPGSRAPVAPAAAPEAAALAVAPPWPPERPSRRDVIAAVQSALGPHDVLLATTGYTGREMTALADRPNQLAMVGSMGCATSLGLGLACARPDRRVVVLDGDGAALMRLGALATVGWERPPNLVHVLLDNEVHDSTGGQPTATSRADLAAVARACGYPRVLRAPTCDAVARAVGDDTGALAFVHVKVAATSGSPPPRPVTPPATAAARLAAWLAP